MSLIVPHWIPSNLWWALPLLAAALGAALRRVLPRTAAARGAPVCLLAGAFSGASFPVQPGEPLCLGSDPAHCQIVLPGTAAAARQCLLQYDSVRGRRGGACPVR